MKTQRSGICNINRPCQLRGGEGKSLYLIAAYPQSLKQGTFKRLVPGLNFSRTLYEIKKDWDRFLAKGMQIETPESKVNHACKASLIQGFMTVTGSDVKYFIIRKRNEGLKSCRRKK